MKTVHVEIYTYYFLKGVLNCDEIGCLISDFVFIDKLKERVIGQSTLINTLDVYRDDMDEWYIVLPNINTEELTFIEEKIEVL